MNAIPASGRPHTIFGIGFPPFHGGLMSYADREMDLRKVVDRLADLAQRNGGGALEPARRYKVPPRLAKLAESGGNLCESEQ